MLKGGDVFRKSVIWMGRSVRKIQTRESSRPPVGYIDIRRGVSRNGEDHPVEEARNRSGTNQKGRFMRGMKQAQGGREPS